jgi:hypothetical protein
VCLCAAWCALSGRVADGFSAHPKEEEDFFSAQLPTRRSHLFFPFLSRAGQCQGQCATTPEPFTDAETGTVGYKCLLAEKADLELQEGTSVNDMLCATCMRIVCRKGMHLSLCFQNSHSAAPPPSFISDPSNHRTIQFRVHGECCACVLDVFG